MEQEKEFQPGEIVRLKEPELKVLAVRGKRTIVELEVNGCWEVLTYRTADLERIPVGEGPLEWASTNSLERIRKQIQAELARRMVEGFAGEVSE